MYAIVPAKEKKEKITWDTWKRQRSVSETVHPTKGRSKGIDTYGRKYKFPHRAFRIMKITNNDDCQRYRDFLINVPKEAQFEVNEVGNVEIKFEPKSWEEMQRNRWIYDDSPVFRMYTDIKYAYYSEGDMSEYDADPKKPSPSMRRLGGKLTKATISSHPRSHAVKNATKSPCIEDARMK